MDFSGLADRLPFGKYLPGAVYIARSCLPPNGEHQRLVQKIAGDLDEKFYTVVKWHRDAPRVSLLGYPTFLSEPHPALQKAITIDLASGQRTVTEFTNTNPPILHRCEDLLHPEHPQGESLRHLTLVEERFGLYRQTARIGFRDHWQNALVERGLIADGFHLTLGEHVPKPVGAPVPAWQSERHRTAIHRVAMSVPVRLLLNRGLIRPTDRFFDYGCGHGQDVRSLGDLGITAAGWDPCHAPALPLVPSDVVHCGYVLNVVEDPDERTAVVRAAWALAERILCVAVRIRMEDALPTGEPWGDGERTKLGTFQKYFAPDEFVTWLDGVLGQPTLALAPGIVVVARDAAILTEALARRTRSIPIPVHPKSPTSSEKAVTESNNVQFDSIDGEKSTEPDNVSLQVPTETCLPPRRRMGPRQRAIAAALDELDPVFRDLGRCPIMGEIELSPTAQVLGMSLKSWWKAWVERIGEEEAERFASRRRSDTIVALAMAHFKRIPRLAELPQRMQTDIDVLCGGIKSTVTEAARCLRAMGDPRLISTLCDDAGRQGLGVTDSQALYLHQSTLSRLDPILRCYVGCAEVLGAPVAEADILKLHKASRKVTLLIYQDFATAPLPALIERIKVDLRAHRVMVFDHRAEPRQLLYDKDLYLAEDDPQRTSWCVTSEALTRLIGPVTGRGPDHLQLRSLLKSAGADPDIWVPETYSAPAPDDYDEQASEDSQAETDRTPRQSEQVV